MSNTVIELRHSYVTGNVPSSLANGEIAINTYDGKLFYRGGVSNTIQTIERFTGPAGLNQEVQFNDSGVLGADSGLTYNKTTDVLTVVGGAIIGGINVAPQIQFSFNQANAAFIAANSAGVYANGAFATANNEAGVNLTQNNSITAAFTQANSNFVSAITRLTVTNSGASAYLIDQYSGNNPSIYVSGGETIAFQLNGISGHPFMIRVSSGGSNYDTGLTHVANNGTVSTGSSAQGQVAGTLYWKVPFDIVGSTYVYQCSVHSGMVGNIVIQQPASFVASNTTLAFNTANAAFLAANAATATDTTQNNSITAAFTTANSAGVYANGAFAAANAATATDTTQNNSITAAFTAANSAGVYANGAFARANNSLNANTGGTVTANVTISANLTAANVATQTYIQFGDGTKQFTANSAGNETSDQFARDTANGAFAAANAATATDATQNTRITYAENHANAAFDFANTISGGSAIDNVARSLANTAQIHANFAFNHANGAFAQANTDFTNISISPSQTYGNATHVPIVTITANGRINAISTVAVTATDPSAIAFAIALG